MKKLAIIPVLLLLVLYYFYPNNEGLIVFLTWDNEDTSHTMTVNYLTANKFQTTQVYYDTKSHAGRHHSNYRYLAYGSQRTYPEVKFTVHSTQLKDLNPGASYYFIVGDSKSGFTEERKFRTVPAQGTIRFISGGDAGMSDEYKKISEIAAATEPHFAIMGGDIAYVSGNTKQQDTWIEFLDIWQQTMITPDGYTIPIIAVIGNHETNKVKWRPIDIAPFYFMLFKPNGGRTYFTRRLGLNNILFALDTNHIYKPHGEQLDWMQEEFKKYDSSTFRFASYHIPLYPSFHDPDKPHIKNLRRHWLPVFDQTQLHVAFENHEHTLKKSWLLKGNKVAEKKGTYYLGDGNWGRPSRIPKEQWYIEKTRPINHVWSVVLDGENASFEALTIDGVDDDYTFQIKASAAKP